MPSEGVTLTPATHLLSQDEIIKIAQIFVSEGVKKVSPSGFPCFHPISSCHSDQTDRRGALGQVGCGGDCAETEEDLWPGDPGHDD